jgi:hypothetical protein
MVGRHVCFPDGHRWRASGTEKATNAEPEATYVPQTFALDHSNVCIGRLRALQRTLYCHPFLLLYAIVHRCSPALAVT